MNYLFGLPQNNQYADFLSVDSFLTAEETSWIRNLWSPTASKPATISSTQGIEESSEYRKTDVMFLSPEQSLLWLFERLGQAAIQNNNHHYNFDIVGFFEELQLAHYENEGHFDWHMDFGSKGSNRKLSLSIQLSDPDSYEGGDLQFLINNKPFNAPKNLGTLIIFPSYVMHRVTPITSGSRMSIVGWVTGPPFR